MGPTPEPPDAQPTAVPADRAPMENSPAETARSAAPRDAEAATSRPPSTPQAVLHVWTLWNLVLAGPLYAVLGNAPMFFVARRGGATDLVALALILSFALPAAVAAVGAGLRRLRPNWARVYWVICAGAASGTAALVAGNRVASSGGAALVAVAVAVGALGALAYARFATARTFITVLWPSVIVMPAYFLAFSPAADLLWIRPAPHEPVRVGKAAPIVVVVFDEFCGMSLLDQRREIDAARYPNFAALSREALWLRNATTNSPDTHQALLALLTGRFPRPEALPTTAHCPRNLFTLLADSHELHAWEAATLLGPPARPAVANRAPASATADHWTRRLSGLLVDAAVIELHLVVPRDWRGRLPELSGRWSNFLDLDWAGPPDPTRRRAEIFDEFLASLERGERPGCWFLHSMLPHVPWELTASGRTYTAPIAPRQFESPHAAHGLIGLRRHSEVWDDDVLAVVQAQQRYLLQVQHVDRLLGRLIDRLKRAGLYDECLLVVTADHGVAFQPGEARRELNARTAAEILPIPMFLKLPRQSVGATSDRNVQSVDLLPTIVAALGIETSWAFDGRPILGDDETDATGAAAGAARARHTGATAAPDGAGPYALAVGAGLQPLGSPSPTAQAAPAARRDAIEPKWKTVFPAEESSDAWLLPGDFPERFQTAEKMLARLGSGDQPARFYQIGPRGELVGRRAGDLLETDSSRGGTSRRLQVEWRCGPPLDGAEPDGAGAEGAGLDFETAWYVGGRVVSASEALDGALTLAITVDGIVGAVTRPFRVPGFESNFAAMVPCRPDRMNPRRLGLYVVRDVDGGVELEPVETTSRADR